MHLTKITLLLFATLLGVTDTCKTQDEEKNIATIMAKFESMYPDARKVSWEKDDHGNYEVKFKRFDEKYRADFRPNGQWIETENTIKFDHLPKSVRDAVERAYDKDDIEEIEQVHHYQKGIFYDVEIDEKGKKKIDIEYNALGQIIGKEY